MSQRNRPRQVARGSNAKAEVVIAIDVECVATGCGHLDRTPVSVAICNAAEELVFHELIRPAVAVHNYLTPLTGFEAHHFENARSFTEVMADVRTHLGPTVVLVGQGIENDVRWLELTAGTDFKRFIDLADRFTTEIKHHGNVKHVVHGLQHVAKICLPDYVPAAVHSASNDALISMRLFKLSGGPVVNKKALTAMHHQLRQGGRPERSYLANHSYVVDDVCCAAYSLTPCRCGQPNVKVILNAAPGTFPYPYPVVEPPSVSAAPVPPADAPTGINFVPTAAPTPAAQAPAPPVALGPAAAIPTAVSAVAPVPLPPQAPREDFLPSCSTIQESVMRYGGFNPHANYRDDHDNLYGDFYGNSGGSGRYDYRFARGKVEILC